VIRVISAWREFRHIKHVEQKDKPTHLFRVVNLLGSKRYEKTRAKALKDAEFASLLRRSEKLPDILQDMERLKKCPEGSLGKAYFDFMSSEELDYAAFLSSTEEAGFEATNELEKAFEQREKTIHDLIHVLFEYTRASRFGEGATLATHYWQGGATGYGAVAFFGLLRVLKEQPKDAWAVLRGYASVYRRQRGVNFRMYPFETRLHQQIKDVRRELKIKPMKKWIYLCEKNSQWN